MATLNVKAAEYKAAGRAAPRPLVVSDKAALAASIGLQVMIAVVFLVWVRIGGPQRKWDTDITRSVRPSPSTQIINGRELLKSADQLVRIP